MCGGRGGRPPQVDAVELRCPRCLAHLHDRKRNSLIRTSALLAAAVLCYVPANLLPIMTVVNLGAQQSDTENARDEVRERRTQLDTQVDALTAEDEEIREELAALSANVDAQRAELEEGEGAAAEAETLRGK